MAVALNKVDQIRPKERLLGLLADCAAMWPGVELVPVSARTGEGVESLLKVIREFLPAGPPLFPEDQLSTVSVRFLASEIIREKLFLGLEQELPYNVPWRSRVGEIPEQNMTMIAATIYTSKNSTQGHDRRTAGQKSQEGRPAGQAGDQKPARVRSISNSGQGSRGLTEDGQFMISLGLGA
jgi:GTP-binding protein Era